jgi:hypothetical protein
MWCVHIHLWGLNHGIFTELCNKLLDSAFPPHMGTFIPNAMQENMAQKGLALG